MGLPVYPPDLAAWMRRIEAQLRALHAAAQSRIRYEKILAALLAVGEGGSRVEISPGPPPSIRWYPLDGESANYSEITSDPDIVAGEATLLIKSGLNSGGTAMTIYRQSGGLIRARVLDADGNISTGGTLEVTGLSCELGFRPAMVSTGGGGYVYGDHNLAELGFDDDAGNRNRLTFTTNYMQYFGKFPDFVNQGSSAGLFTGTVAGTSGASSVSISYGPTMDSSMVPLYSVQDDVVHSSALTSASTTGFTVTISPAANGPWNVFFWCFRI